MGKKKYKHPMYRVALSAPRGQWIALKKLLNKKELSLQEWFLQKITEEVEGNL